MTWTITCRWLEVGSGLQEATVEMAVLPSTAGPFRHPDVADGATMQVTGVMPDEAKMTATIGLAGPDSWPPKAGVLYPDFER